MSTLETNQYQPADNDVQTLCGHTSEDARKDCVADTDEAAGQSSESGQKKNRRWRVLALVLIVLLALCLALCSWRDPNAKKGHYEGKTPEQIQEDLDMEVAADSMAISVASVIEMRAGETTVEARIENLESNHCDQCVRIYPMDNPDDVLFTSGAIAPGEYLQEVELAHSFEPGSYELLVEFQGYEQTPTLVSDEGKILSHDRFGASCAAQVTLKVLAD